MSIFEAKTYKEMPAKEEIEQQYLRYVEQNGVMKRKAGMTARVSIRYGIKDFYHKIGEKEIFGNAEGFEIARFIEVTLMEIMQKKIGHYLEHLDSGPCRKSGKTDKYVVYLVTGKTEEDRCPICERVLIELEEDRKTHLDHHMKERKALEWLKAMGEKLGDEEAVEDANEYLGWPSRAEEKPSASKKSKKD